MQFIIFLQTARSTCFGWWFHPPSGAHITVNTASGTGQTVSASFHCRGAAPRQCKVAETVWPVPEAVITVICAPDDGWNHHPKHVERAVCRNIINCIQSSLLVGRLFTWIPDARTHEPKKNATLNFVATIVFPRRWTRVIIAGQLMTLM
jgi:hypothetical protein